MVCGLAGKAVLTYRQPMLSRVFLDWSQPFLPSLAVWLLAGAPRIPAPDLSNTVVVLPTAAAGRSLREHLARLTLESAMLLPHIITPDVILTWASAAADSVAGRGEEIAAWASVLTSLKLEQWRALFPVDPVAQDIRWATGAAADLLKLRRTLEEGGRNLAQAAAALGPAHPEAARWSSLAKLEAMAVTRLEVGGWQDPITVRLAAARAPVLPEGVTRVVVAGVPDSIHLVRLALEKIAETPSFNLTIVIHAPESAGASFDAWGRPNPEVWTRQEIKLPKGNDSVTLTTRPEDAAGILLEALTNPKTRDTTVIGTADPEVSAPLRRRAAAAKIEVYDPDGLPLLEHEISWLLQSLTQLLRTGSWAAASQLLRVPDVLAAACRRGHLQSLEAWDDFQSERLPQNLSQAAPLARHWSEARHGDNPTEASPADHWRHPDLPGMLEWFQRTLTALKNAPLPTAVATFLETLYRGRKFATPADRQRFTHALAAWQEALESVERGAAAFLPGLSPADRLELAGSMVRDNRLYAPHPENAYALHGWLELPWQDAPHIIIAGMNEGMVPDSVQGDAWLPDSVRALLDLKTNETRLARDSYLLTAMIAGRRGHGSIRLLAGRMTSAGDPLKPSRLLLRCSAVDLPSRALRLFPREITTESDRPPSPPWHRAWTLKLPMPRPDAKVFQRLSVTAFGDYLKCPFRFYLKHGLKMEGVDASITELEANTVGNIFHNTMEAFHKTAQRDSSDAAEIARILHAEFDNTIAETYGSSLTIPVVMQLEVIRNCLTKAAEIHAAESEKGWRFEQVEMAFPTLVRLQGTEIRGRIDLIQRHPQEGYRILDYKTSSTAKHPAEAHLKAVTSKAAQEALRTSAIGHFATVEHRGKVHVWQNLQLPLYARIMADHYGVEKVGVGYINLPRAVNEARLEMWEDIDEPLLESAWQCAKGVISNIQQGIFWPPGPKVQYDDFESLVFQDAESSFDSTALKRVQSMIAAGEFKPVLSSPV